MWRDTADGATYSWIEIASSGFDLDLIDDELSTPQTLSFQFNFYGTNYNQIKISSNGWITFDTNETSSWAGNYGIPGVDGPPLMVAAFWDDLDPPTLPGEVYFEDFGTYAVIQWDDVEKYLTNTYNTFEIILYDSGTIKLQYQTVDSLQNSCTVGIENTAEDDGLECLYNGTGVTLSDSYAIEFYTGISVIDCTGATSISCGDTLTNITSSFSDVITDYGCNGTTYDGDEEVFEFVLATEANVTITISHGGGERLDVFLLSDCNEVTNCIAWGDNSITATQLSAGTYYIVVDGERNGDTGPFDISVDCDATCSINCSSSCDIPIFTEDFDAGLPGTWTIQDSGDSTDTWFEDDVSDPSGCGSINPASPLSGIWMAVDSDCYGDGIRMQEGLRSPRINCTTGGPFSEIHLTFDHYYRHSSSDTALVQARSSNTGDVWQTVQTWNASTTNPAAVDIDIFRR